MIRYDLICEQEHAFDGWFRDSDGFDKLRSSGNVTCPMCGSTKVSKQLMTPGVPAKGNRKSQATQPVFAGPQTPKQRELLAAMRKLRQHVEDNADYVGNRFAEEARKIHYNETEARGIYGEASMDDAKSLLEEGVEISPLPVLPEDGN